MRILSSLMLPLIVLLIRYLNPNSHKQHVSDEILRKYYGHITAYVGGLTTRV